MEAQRSACITITPSVNYPTISSNTGHSGKTPPHNIITSSPNGSHQSSTSKYCGLSHKDPHQQRMGCRMVEIVLEIYGAGQMVFLRFSVVEHGKQLTSYQPACCAPVSCSINPRPTEAPLAIRVCQTSALLFAPLHREYPTRRLVSDLGVLFRHCESDI